MKTKLTQLVILVCVLVKIGVMVYYQIQTHQSTEKLVTQQFLLIETLNTQFKKLQQSTTQTSPIQSREKRYRLSESPHTKHITRIEDEAGMGLRSVAEHIMRNEGKRPDPYPDNIGVAVGVGRNLTTYGVSTLELRAINPEVDVTQHLEKISIGEKRVYIQDLETAKTILNTPLTDHHIALLLLSNLKNVAKEAEQVFEETWQKLDGARKESILDVMFNLGLTHFSKFKKFIEAIKINDFDEAANELLLSKAAQQNPTRYQRNAAVIRTGDVKYFELE